MVKKTTIRKTVMKSFTDPVKIDGMTFNKQQLIVSFLSSVDI